jgi:rhamnosyltransferase
MLLPLNSPVFRIAMYVIYDKHGVIDDYILYQLANLKPNLSRLLVLVNGLLSEDGYTKLEPLADYILVRENKGFDAEAYKQGLEYIGWDAVSQYDELLLMNDTCFGPLYPFKTVFDTMNARDCDFWGINKAPPRHDNGWEPLRYGFVPAHLYSNFICLRKTILQSLLFKAYWKALPPIKTFKDAVIKHEFLFTKYFEDRGFAGDKLVKDDDLYEATQYPLILMAKEVVAGRNCPIFKRKSFTQFDEFCAESARDATRALYEYVRDAADYNVDMIWKHILRVGNIAEIKNAFHLNYIVPKDCIIRRGGVRPKAALFFRVYYLDVLDETMTYIKNMPDDADIYIATGSEEAKAMIMRALAETNYRYTVKLTAYRGGSLGALLTAFRERVDNYEVVCFAHDMQTVPAKPAVSGEDRSFTWLENVLGSEQYIENVLGTFEKEERLGVLTPPPESPGKYGDSIEDTWANCFENTKALLEALGIRVPLDKAKPPIAACGSCVWFRPKALAALFRRTWAYEDFPVDPRPAGGNLIPVLERSFAYVAQSAGYYTGRLLNDRYASLELTALWHSMAALHASRSWKLTKPLRLGIGLLKSIRAFYSHIRLHLHQRFSKTRVPPPLSNPPCTSKITLGHIHATQNDTNGTDDIKR